MTHPTHGRTGYDSDLPSPAALALLPKAVVIDGEEPEALVPIAAWELQELPGPR